MNSEWQRIPTLTPGYVRDMSDVPNSPQPIIPEPDPTHTPTIPDPDPNHVPPVPPTVPDPDPQTPEPGPLA